MNLDSACSDRNLVLIPGVRISVSNPTPTGGGAQDPHILLNDRACRLDGGLLSDFSAIRTYDTYDGQNQSIELDWYALEFPASLAFNCIEMTMGIPYHDGGWWRSLTVEIRANETDLWSPVNALKITPDYRFEDTTAVRLPFETYALTFDKVIARHVRLIGVPGGSAQFTSLARIGVFRRDLSRWNPIGLNLVPRPYVFKLLSPSVMWDLSNHFSRLTGIALDFSFMQYYLDPVRLSLHFDKIKHNYQGEPDLWFLVGDSIGWRRWNTASPPTTGSNPIVQRILNDVLGRAVAPVIIADEVLGCIETHYVVVKGSFDEGWHRDFAEAHGIPWDTYFAAYMRSPQMTIEQLEGAAGLLGMIANTIANLMQRNLSLERELDSAQQGGRAHLDGQAIARKAIDYMQANLETSLTVADVAKAMALSVPYFCTLFHKHTGHTPGDYLSGLRVERAKEYLAYSPMSVLDICETLGYNPSYFSRLFKRLTGLTPGEYARRMRSGHPKR